MRMLIIIILSFVITLTPISICANDELSSLQSDISNNKVFRSISIQIAYGEQNKVIEGNIWICNPDTRLRYYLVFTENGNEIVYRRGDVFQNTIKDGNSKLILYPNFGPVRNLENSTLEERNISENQKLLADLPYQLCLKMDKVSVTSVTNTKFNNKNYLTVNGGLRLDDNEIAKYQVLINNNINEWIEIYEYRIDKIVCLKIRIGSNLLGKDMEWNIPKTSEELEHIYIRLYNETNICDILSGRSDNYRIVNLFQ